MYVCRRNIAYRRFGAIWASGHPLRSLDVFFWESGERILMVKTQDPNLPEQVSGCWVKVKKGMRGR